MTPETLAKVIFALDTASNDPRATAELRRNAERQIRNQLAVARFAAKKLPVPKD